MSWSIRAGLAAAVTCLLAMGAPAFAQTPVDADEAAAPKTRILVFSKTAAFRHGSIDSGVEALEALAEKHGFAMDATEDAAAFSAENLRPYDAVVFLSTTGDVLDEAQQQAFEDYIGDGGGYVGVHSAADTEYDWPFYGELVGAYFKSHPTNPHLQDARIDVGDHQHPSTRHLPSKWNRVDEWYSYGTSPRGKVHVLATLDERSYIEGGAGPRMGGDHPIAWCHKFGGGRSWYTGGGHTHASYGESKFRRHMLGGILWAAGAAKGDCRATVDSSFQKVTLNDHPGEPMGLAVLPDRRVLSTTRDGDVRMHDPKTGLNTIAARLPVYFHDEEGLQSVAIDPNFDENRWVYLYYSPPLDTPLDDPATAGVNEGEAPATGTEADFEPFRGALRLSRFKLRGSRLALGSEQKIIDVPTDRGMCCHVGGHIDFDGLGNLFLSTGDDSNPFASGGFTPIDERPDSNPAFDAQRSAGNTNDLRGKLLRIRPRDDRGGYTIPEGNLFPDGLPGTRPEIYAMGLRNPFRFAVNRDTNAVYLADYSPDSGANDPLRGPAGQGKWTVIRAPGNYGWPYCATDRMPYVDYDFATSTSGQPFDCANPVNESPHNTGLRELPPVAAPDVWYGYARSIGFPGLGNGGVGPMGGPAYDPETAGDSRTRWPAYYAGLPLFYEWSRDFVRGFEPQPERGLARMEPVLSSVTLDNPMDLEFGPDGSLYVLEYGDGYNNENPEAQLSRIDYLRGGSSPVPDATAEPLEGEAPFSVSFSGAGSIDADGDPLQYEWHFDDDGDVDSRQQNPSYTFKRDGAYDVTLRVVDPSGRSASTSVQVLVGIARPQVSLDVQPPAGEPFRFGQTVTFELTIDDGGNPIQCERASVTYALGHDEHAHAQSTTVGCSGRIQVNTDDSHSGAQSLAGVFKAEYLSLTEANGSPLRGSDEVVLIPEE